jgi:hypothetical protein
LFNPTYLLPGPPSINDCASNCNTGYSDSLGDLIIDSSNNSFPALGEA